VRLPNRTVDELGDLPRLLIYLIPQAGAPALQSLDVLGMTSDNGVVFLLQVTQPLLDFKQHVFDVIRTHRHFDLARLLMSVTVPLSRKNGWTEFTWVHTTVLFQHPLTLELIAADRTRKCHCLLF
jgi:hypothetical protein